MPQLWWQKAVFYQIYPRSFADSSGDGIGDLDGITSRLDYLAALGIGALWLSPINPSPLRDWGYDVSDYCGIHPDLGDLASFDRLIAQAHRHGIRIILDLVPNHTSDQHPWFIESRSSRSNPKRDWYIWKPGAANRPPNNWLATFGGPAWKYDERTGAWFMHSFLEQQPELNYRNPEVVDAMQNVLRFWLDRGADGFRIDVISYLIKDAQFRDNPQRADLQPGQFGSLLPLYSQDQPEVHDIIRGFRRVLDEYGDRMMVGEVWPREQRSLADYVRAGELHQAFNFRFLFCPWDANSFRDRIEEVENLFAARWPTYTLSNHDFPRHISRYGKDGDAVARARVAAILLLTLRGTPFLYMGEEIGMPDVEVPASKRRDPIGRDGCRTPMQWSDAPNGGFTAAAEPWLPCGDYKNINVAKQTGDPGSLLEFYREMISLRQRTSALLEGGYRTISNAAENCLAFLRETAEQKVLVALNFSADSRRIDVPAATPIFSSHPGRPSDRISGAIELQPNEAVILQLQS